VEAGWRRVAGGRKLRAVGDLIRWIVRNEWGVGKGAWEMGGGRKGGEGRERKGKTERKEGSSGCLDVDGKKEGSE